MHSHLLSLATTPNLVCPVTANACGDPHLAGFRGQKFDFTGEEGAWYSMVYDGPCLSVNMRITAPVPETPAITYITGVGMTLCDSMGVSHTIELTVDEPHVLESHCPESDVPCLADGALSLILDGARMTRPGQVGYSWKLLRPSPRWVVYLSRRADT